MDLFYDSIDDEIKDGAKVKMPAGMREILQSLPRGVWYAVIWDSDGDFLISNAENKPNLPDLFCKLKRKRLFTGKIEKAKIGTKRR